MPIKNEYGCRLRQARESLDKLQRAFGAPLELSEAQIKDLETGRKKITLEIAVSIEKTHGIDLRWLLTGEGEMFVERGKEQLPINASVGDNSLVGQIGHGNGNTYTLSRDTDQQEQPHPSEQPESSSTKLALGKDFEVFTQLSRFLSMDDAANIFLASIVASTSGNFYSGVASYAFFKFLVPSVEGLKASASKNVQKFMSFVKEKLAKRGITQPRPLHPALVMKALITIPFEDREELQKIWATFLVNAVDPHFEKERIRKEFFEILSEMSALDVKIFNHIASSPYDSDRLGYIFKTFTENEYIVNASICRLTKDSLISIPSVSAYGGLSKFDIANPETHYLFNRAGMTLQGEEFLQAISPPDKPGNG
jgi:DNA-binding XRE family transcriptional regulator